MKIKILLLFILTLFYACSKDSSTIPDCIKDKIDAMLPLSSVQLLGVYKFKIDGQYHYWFNTSQLVSDYEEYIYDEKCEEVCSYCGFCIKSNCLDNYPPYGSDIWEVVWKP